MAIPVYLPKMSDHMETGRIAKWYFKEGDRVERGQILLELETDKAVGEVEASESGILSGIQYAEGQDAPVGVTIAYLLKDGEALPGSQPAQAAPPGPVEAAAAAYPSPNGGSAALEDGPLPPRATPLARRVARELAVDLARVTGSGPRGIIRDEDVRAYHASTSAAVTETAPAAVVPPAPAVPAPLVEAVVPLNTLQQVAALRMAESFASAPHFYLQVSVDMTRALELIEQVRERILQEAGAKVSVTALLVKAAAAGLKRFPHINAAYEKDHLRVFEQVNIGVAVGAEAGLVVPVIRSAGAKTLADITAELKAFQAKAESMHFTPEDLAGGTFTISNLGMYGIDVFHAILNPPQSAILAVGRIIKTPVGMPDDTIALRPMMNLSLSVDHRAIDGLHAARFLAELKALLESPYLLI
jgi:pyruvate dehydrogenase E2 component (dihydrolipoamide acetyltransferase)